MEGPSSLSTTQSAAVEGNNRQRGSGRQKYIRGRAQGRGGNASLSFRPSSVGPSSSAQAEASQNAVEGDSQSKSRGQRGKGGKQRGQKRTVNGRQFGGQLTTQTVPPVTTPESSQFQATATSFVPGREHFVSSGSIDLRAKRGNLPRQQSRQPEKSQAPDIATRTHEDIDNGHYECAICTSEVQRKAKVWYCHLCWTVFHLSCIKKWSGNEGSAVSRKQSDETASRQWRCPGCNLPQDELPTLYTCWCRKETEPRAPAGIPPHSCGQSCGKERAKRCPHACSLTCHAGPCPPCDFMAPTQMCFCGKHEVTKRCSETDYDSGWSCGKVCHELMPCGEHKCARSCHEGVCGACDVLVPARCYCGKDETVILCSDRMDNKTSYRTYSSGDGKLTTESWVGMFECTKKCGRPLDCGVHVCERGCHAASTDKPAHCPRSPDVVTHCSCGKTALETLTNQPRKTCLDAIPSCQLSCEKLLPCGHACKEICHLGNCPPCMQKIDIKCRCGRTSSRSLCHQGGGELSLPQCPRVCRVQMSCGRHACDEHCCAGERKAIERQGSKRKQRPFSAAPRVVDDGFEAEHICTRQCGRLLKCGSKPCGHPQVPHNCHQDDEACPRCPFLMEKKCLCGRKTLKNQQCWLNDVRCGEVCGKKLRCGSHFCRELCHTAGECEDAAGPCKQQCGKEKKACGHPDLEHVCHAPFPCKEDQPCQSKIYATCACQAQKQEMKCAASKVSEGNMLKTLPCNDECARLERNRRLAVALNIDQSTHIEGGDHIPFSTETLNMFAEHVKWGQNQEREFRVFATSEDEKRLRFKPMQSRQRTFLHSLAEDFGLDHESMDPEPHRHVMIWKTPRFVSAPNKTLAEALRIRQAARSIAAGTNVLDSEAGTMKSKVATSSDEPYNSFVISSPRFGLTVDELQPEITAALSTTAGLTFDIEFLPVEEVVLKAKSASLQPADLQAVLQRIKSVLVTSIASKGYGNAQLCVTDKSTNIIRRESDSGPGDGWSRVAAKKAAQKMTLPPPSVFGSNTFAALSGNKITFAKKKIQKPRKESVVDDWEIAETAEEEKEKDGSSGEIGIVGPRASGGEHQQVMPNTEATLVTQPITLDNEPSGLQV
nr:fkbp12-associated protein 1 like [Quercus suber]